MDWDAPFATSSPTPAASLTPTPLTASPAPNGLVWGPRPGTVLGPEGHVLELIPSDPNERFVCEPLPKSSDAGKTLSRRDFVD